MKFEVECGSYGGDSYRQLLQTGSRKRF
jgi:hypothetical protein